MDGKADIQMLSFEATKIRHLRSLYIESQTMQVSCFNMSFYLLYDAHKAPFYSIC